MRNRMGAGERMGPAEQSALLCIVGTASEVAGIRVSVVLESDAPRRVRVVREGSSCGECQADVPYGRGTCQAPDGRMRDVFFAQISRLGMQSFDAH